MIRCTGRKKPLMMQPSFAVGASEKGSSLEGSVGDGFGACSFFFRVLFWAAAASAASSRLGSPGKRADRWDGRLKALKIDDDGDRRSSLGKRGRLGVRNWVDGGRFWVVAEGREKQAFFPSAGEKEGNKWVQVRAGPLLPPGAGRRSAAQRLRWPPLLGSTTCWLTGRYGLYYSAFGGGGDGAASRSLGEHHGPGVERLP
ncbi:hypothetical protein J3F83DRAFT_312518 [Trichoderma novae-zelandiae]